MGNASHKIMGAVVFGKQKIAYKMPKVRYLQLHKLKIDDFFINGDDRRNTCTVPRAVLKASH